MSDMWQTDDAWALSQQEHHLSHTLQHSERWCGSCCAGGDPQHEDHTALAAAVPVSISIECLGPLQATHSDTVRFREANGTD